MKCWIIILLLAVAVTVVTVVSPVSCSVVFSNVSLESRVPVLVQNIDMKQQRVNFAVMLKLVIPHQERAFLRVILE